jgi:hypothetical protein
VKLLKFHVFEWGRQAVMCTLDQSLHIYLF